MNFGSSMMLFASGSAVLTTFAIYMVGVFALAVLSNRLLSSKNFLSEYFLSCQRESSPIRKRAPIAFSRRRLELRTKRSTG